MIVDSAGCADFSFYRHDMFRTPLYGICYMWHRIRETRGATLCGRVLGESPTRTWSQRCVSPLRLKRGRADKGTCCRCLGQEPWPGAQSWTQSPHVYFFTRMVRWNCLCRKAPHTLSPQILNCLSQLCEISTNSDGNQMLWTQTIQTFCYDWPRINRKLPLFNTARPRPHVIMSVHTTLTRPGHSHGKQMIHSVWLLSYIKFCERGRKTWLLSTQSCFYSNITYHWPTVSF